MSYRVASEAYSISVSSIAKRLKGKVRMDASVGAGTVLTLEEENSLEDALIWAAHRHLGVGRLELKQAVTKLCNDGRLVPWARDTGPGRKWLISSSGGIRDSSAAAASTKRTVLPLTMNRD
ncbi:unnamed protein product [Ascophyllum nodosum]